MQHIKIGGYVLIIDVDGIWLNKNLIDQQNAWKNLDNIAELHHFKLSIYSLLSETKDESLMKSLSLDLREIEFELQDLWGFKKNMNLHRFWEYPKCLCPKLDNIEDYPHRQYFNNKCPLHGNKNE